MFQDSTGPGDCHELIPFTGTQPLAIPSPASCFFEYIWSTATAAPLEAPGNMKVVVFVTLLTSSGA
jgi:hypothetical protein